MVYDARMLVCVPCAFYLMIGRSELMYCIALHKLFVLQDYHWMLSVVTVDFKKGMLASYRLYYCFRS
ncbi:hypothetical protein MXB_791 [Myxobolus squamalis]|nr:hypothetical protein MXB_791 [Myxobolus squamalis]